MASNQLISLPKEITQLKKLRILTISYNKIESLPESFGNLKKLESLQLQFNSLKSLPASFGGCINLKFLFLGRNNITEISDTFADLHNLKELYIAEAGPMLVLSERLCELRFLEYIQVDRFAVIPRCLQVLQANRLRLDIIE